MVQSEEMLESLKRAVAVLRDAHVAHALGGGLALWAIGSSGVFIEVFGDRQLGLVPIDARIADRMIDKLAVATILDGTRGRPPVDKASVTAALVALSDLAADLGDLIAELDVNPLAVTGDGCLALDALVIPAAATDATT